MIDRMSLRRSYDEKKQRPPPPRVSGNRCSSREQIVKSIYEHRDVMRAHESCATCLSDDPSRALHRCTHSRRLTRSHWHELARVGGCARPLRLRRSSAGRVARPPRAQARECPRDERGARETRIRTRRARAPGLCPPLARGPEPGAWKTAAVAAKKTPHRAFLASKRNARGFLPEKEAPTGIRNDREASSGGARAVIQAR